MPSAVRRRALALVLAGAAIALVGCGMPEVATPSPSATANPDRFQLPRALDSYRYTMEIRGDGQLLDRSEAPPGLGLEDAVIDVKIEGRWVSPDREYSSVRFSFGVLRSTRATTRIGERFWSSVEGGAWRERAPLNGPEDLVGQDIPLSPDAIFDDDEDEILDRLTADLDARPHTVEVVNGREARHWTLDEEWFAGFRDDFDGVLAGLTKEQELVLKIDIWSDVETGVGTKLAVEAHLAGETEGLRMVMELFDLNDPEITVEEPAGAIGR